jgi:hypothetical protein
VALWLITGVIAGTLVDTTRDRFDPSTQGNGRWWVVSFGANLDRLREAALDTPEAYRRVVMAYQRAAAMAANVAQAQAVGPGRGPLSRILGRRNPQPIQAPPPMPGADESEPPAMFANQITPPFLWTWSVAVLGGLSLLSVIVLSNRIKSLDRLR